MERSARAEMAQGILEKKGICDLGLARVTREEAMESPRTPSPLHWNVQRAAARFCLRGFKASSSQTPAI